MRPRKFTEHDANSIFDVLVEHAGASEHTRPEFLACCQRGVTEFRFQGLLQFGGKFRAGWENGFDLLYVDCYPEHLDHQRQQVIDRTNAALTHLCKHTGLASQPGETV